MITRDGGIVLNGTFDGMKLDIPKDESIKTFTIKADQVMEI